MAALAVPVLILEIWTLAAWIPDAHQVTTGRDPSALSWYVARIYEGMAVVVAVPVIIYVIRGCRRERQILTFDAMFCLCGATVFWLDVFCNALVPVWLSSTQWINLTNPCGHMPFMVNPDCGRAVDPLLMDFFAEAFGTLGAAIVAGALVRRARERWPHMGTAKLVGLIFAFGIFVDLLWEIPMVSVGLANYPPIEFMPALEFGSGLRFPIAETFLTGSWFAFAILLRVFKNDKGLTYFERNLEGLSPGKRKAVTLLAMYLFFQVVFAVFADGIGMAGPYESQWQKMPDNLLNSVCDGPGVSGTRYGPCPGSPGFRAPVRHSLPGESP